jgi:hypothetical protein
MRVQEAGPLGRRFINTRAQITLQQPRTTPRSKRRPSSCQTFTSGDSSARSRRSPGSPSSDLDYVRGITAAGVQLLPEWYRSDDRTNYLGTYIRKDATTRGRLVLVVGLSDCRLLLLAGRGNLQDDIRLRRNSLSPGVRIGRESRQ